MSMDKTDKLLISGVFSIIAGIGIVGSVKAADYQAILNKFDVNCEVIEHVKQVNFGNIIAWDVTCTNINGTFIYQYVPEQMPMTHYIGK